jgi:hypothetical protein
MSQDSRDLVTFVLGTIVTLSIIAGLATRYVLIPYLRDNLLSPVAETHKQVTENHHEDAEAPTLPDRIADVSRDVKALTVVMDEHMRWSDRWTDLIEREVDQLRKRTERHP